MRDLGTILAVDDEPNIRRLIRNEFTLEGYDVATASNGEECLAMFKHKPFDVVLLDIRLPKIDGFEVLRKIKDVSKATEVIMITGYGDIQSAVKSLKLGARDYVTKPFKLDDLLTIVQKAVSISKAGKLQPWARPKNFVACTSAPMQAVYQLARRVAGTDHTVLLQGETGVGKDVLAVQIHQQSRRKKGHFVVVDCGLLSENLAESELYGHRKGAFSGAGEDKMGLVEKSHGGTLFLDEVGNIDIDLQKKFLRFLETRQFRRVGETKEHHIDTRVVLATNLDTEKAIRQGTLRGDLFYRITEFVIVIPPLRERPEDILALANHFLEKMSPGGRPKGITKEAQAVLSSYSWPGNIRELKAVIGKCALMTEAQMIRPDDLPVHMRAARACPARPSKSLEDMEKEYIMHVLAETEGNQTRASEVLGINRKTLYKKIHRYKIFS
jgi:DNA-binding NtrC family response regulator